MPQVVIPLDSNDFNYSLDVPLSGQIYRLALYYNNRAGFWNLDVLDTNDTPIAGGIKLVSDWELWGQFNDPALPPGSLYCCDMSGQGLDPADVDLGSRVVLVYDDG